MRAAALAILIVAASASLASAQPGTPIRSRELPPLQQQWLQEGSPPVQQAPVGPYGTRPNAAGPTVGNPSDSQQPPSVTAAPPNSVQRPNVWIPANTVKLQALDKINAQTAALTIKVGQSAKFGSLTITVRACGVRPTDQPVDAAAYLVVTDSHPDSPGFDGWMLAAEPSVSMMQAPVYDIRVVGCT